jgi:hypothetical protein
LKTDSWRQEFLKAVYRHDQSLLFVSVNVNYLFRGSQPGPSHLQMLVAHGLFLPRACGSVRHVLSEKGSAYHADLVDKKKAGSRYIAQTGDGIDDRPLRWGQQVMAVQDRKVISRFFPCRHHDLSGGTSKVSFFENLGI